MPGDSTRSWPESYMVIGERIESRVKTKINMDSS
jgi:hypothetical protein